METLKAKSTLPDMKCMVHPEPDTSQQETKKKANKVSTTQYLVETVANLQAQNEKLKLELTRAKQIPSGKVGILLLVPGVLSLLLSIPTNSQALAFIGLGLTFWGALFFFVRPVKYVKSSLLDSTAIATYSTIDRIIKDLNYRGKSFCIPPYPKDVYLPNHLKGLKDMIVFVSADSGASMPSIEEMAKSRFLIEDPRGITVSPPGLGLFSLIEAELETDLAKLELGTDLTKLNLNDLCAIVPRIMLENFQLAKDIKMQPDKDTIKLRIIGSPYKDLYSREQNLISVHSLGCPIVSALVCATAKSTGKMVTIEKSELLPDEETLEVRLQILGA